MANKCDSSIYRAIAISSLLGKFWTIYYLKINIFLSTYVLKVVYKKCSSATICNTLLLETIYYYYELISYCYEIPLKQIEYVKLIQIQRDRGMCPIVLRLIMPIYVH